MNIYITQENATNLRRYTEGNNLSMSGLINILLADYFKSLDSLQASKGAGK